MKIIVAGGTGLIGSNLLKRLAGKNDIVLFTRDAEAAQKQFEGAGFQIVSWDQPREQLLGVIQNSDALINLTGAGIADAKWSPARKKMLEESRLKPIEKLVELLKRGNIKLKVVLQASAIGLYGNHEEKLFTEKDVAGHNYLAELSKMWEHKATEFLPYTERLVLLRTGVVLTPEGGALKPLMVPFKLFVGGKMGSGKQWVSWIDLEDQLGAILFLLMKNDSKGAYNLTAPQALRQHSLAAAIGKALGRPSWLPVPGFVLKLLMGQMAVEMLLEGNHVKPQRLIEAGYEFQSPDIETALNHLIG
ncbi:MAG: TIGR01777 family oxidoreductase [Bacteroidales bacterium]|jgi:uncharacterized protein (TIGR01777 family)|nr:TIGR01777 family oxidoreductase [Bacteroidales bacterium]